MQTGLLVFTDFVGIVAFALAGILAAEGKNVDPVGVFVMAFTTAFGGGIVRDLIIDNRPMYWIAHEEYVWVTLLMTAVAPVVIRRFRDKTLHTLFGGRYLALAHGGASGVGVGADGSLYRRVRRPAARRLFKSSADGDVGQAALRLGSVCRGVGLRIVELLRRFRICGGFRGDVPHCCPADDLLVLQLGGHKL